LKCFFIGQILGYIGGEFDPVVGVGDVSNGKRYVHQRSHPLQRLDPCVFIQNRYAFVGVLLEPGLTRTVQPVRNEDCVLDRLPMRKHVDFLEDQIETVTCKRVGYAGTVLNAVLVPSWAGRQAHSLVAVGVIVAEVAAQGNVVPAVAGRAGSETSVEEEVVGGGTRCAEGWAGLASRAGDVAEETGESVRVDVLTIGAFVEAEGSPVGQVEPSLAHRTHQVGRTSAPDTLEGARRAIQGNVVSI
jgi:hypothetical protein